MKKKVLAMLLAIVMVAAMLPTAFAADDTVHIISAPADKVSTVTVETLIEPIYEEVGTFGSASADEDSEVLYAAVKVDGKWGYIDLTGEMVIEPQYDYAGGFQEGVAIVAKQLYNTYETTDWETGESYEVTEPEECQIYLLHADGTETALQRYYYSTRESTYVYEDYTIGNMNYDYELDESVPVDPIAASWGCYDGVVFAGYPYLPDGAPIVPQGIESLIPSGHTYSSVSIPGYYYPDSQSVMWGPCRDGVIPMRVTYYWNDETEVVDPETGDTGWDYDDDEGAILFYMDLNGNIIRTFPISSFYAKGYDGVYAGYAPDDTGLSIISYGRWLTSGSWDENYETWYDAEDNIRWGAMRADGTWAVNPVYSSFRYFMSGTFFSQGLWTVTKDGEKWGAVNASGQEVIPLEYDALTGFTDDLSAVQKDGKWFYIDMHNNSYRIGTPEGGVAENILIASHFSNDVAAVYDGERAYCIVNIPVDGVLPAVQGTEDLALSVYFPDYEEFLEIGTLGYIAGVGKYVAIEQDGKWGFLKLTFELEGLNPFEDVHLGDWYYDSIQFAAERGLLAGDGDNNFNPNSEMTWNGAFVVLGRLDGADMEGDDWAEKAVDWAVSEGLVEDGVNSGEQITREELFTLLWKYAGEQSADASVLEDFSDSDTVQAGENYREAMAWAVENGIVKGNGSGKLLPQAIVDRAQAVTLIMNYCDKFED